MPFDGTQYVDPRIEALQRARERIAVGWVQGYEVYARDHWWQFWRAKEKVCALGAISDNDDGIYADGELLVLLHALGTPFGDSDDLTEWNDEPGRTQADVLALYDRAIDSISR